MTNTTKILVNRASLICTVLYFLIGGFNAKATEGETEIVCSNGFKSYQSSVCGTGTATITMLGSNSTYKLWANPAPPQIGSESPLDTEVASSGGGSATLTTPSISTNTTFYVSRVHDSGCESSRMAVTITVYSTPAPNGIASGTGNYCTDETANVTITGTESGVTYKLYKGTTYIRSVSGGGDISIPVTQADGDGTYTVKAQRGSCSSTRTMYGNAVINFYNAPEQKDVTVANGGTFCSPSDVRITLDNGVSGIKYELIDQHNVSYGIKDGGGYDLHWDVDVSRTFRIKAWRNDGYCSTVVYMDDQVTTSVVYPPNPQPLSKGGDFCWSETGTIELENPQDGVKYRIYHSNGNAVTGHTTDKFNSNGATLVWSFPFTDANGDGESDNEGTYIIKGTRIGCATVTMSNSKAISYSRKPDVFTFSGGGQFCNEGSNPGATITLSNSETGIYYHLYGPAGYIKSKPGTNGQPVSWSGTDVDEVGAYSVKASDSATPGSCLRNMTASGYSNVTKVEPPLNRNLTGGGTLCYGQTTTIAVSSPQSGVFYKIFNNDGSEVSGHTAEKQGSNATWSFSFLDTNNDGYSESNGHYKVKARKSGCSAWVPMNNDATVTVNFEQQPLPTTYGGGGEFCDINSSSASVISIDDPQANIYYHLYKKHANNSLDYVSSKRTTTGYEAVEWSVRTNGNYTVKAGIHPNPDTGCLRTLSADSFSDVVTVYQPLNRALSGGGTFCNGETASLSVTNPQSGVYYKLINDDGTDVTGHTTEKSGSSVSWSFTFLDANNDGYSESNGHYKVKARRPGCSGWVTMNDDNSVTVNFEQRPLPKNFSGGGEFCDVNSSSASVIYVDTPQANIYYHLYKKHANNSLDYVSSKRTTTGYEAVEWSVRTNGNYTVKAGIHPNPDTGCLRTLSADSFSDVVTVYQPLNRALSGGGTFCYGQTASISVTSPQSGVLYKLINSDGTDVSGHTTEKSGSSVSWSFTFLDANNDGYSESNGHYKVKARRPGCSGWVTMNDNNTVTVNFEQQPIERYYDGGGEFCDTGSTAGATIQIDNPQANIYYHLYKKHANNSLDYISSKRTTTGYEAVEWTVRTYGNYTIKAGTHPDPTTGCLRPMVARSFTNVSSVYPPTQKDVDGTGEYCWNATAQVELKLSQNGVSYELLRRNGSNYTSISSQNGNGGSLFWDVDFVDNNNDGESESNGYYVVQATGDGCPMVQMVEEANITFSRKPKVFAFDGGGEYCDTGATAGAEIRLLDSESGIWYHLYAPSGALIESKEGTNGELFWSNASVREEGNYIIRAGETQTPDNSCLIAMTRSTDFVAVDQIDQPLRKAVTVTNDGDLCWNETARVSVTAPETDVTYYIYKDGASMPDQFNRPGYQGNVNWDITFSDGDAEYTVRGIREGCAEREMLNAVSVGFTEAPDQFQVTGGGLFCEDGTTQISLSGSEDGMLYRVLRNGEEYTTWTGTGYPNDWTVTAEGNYSIVASISGCDEVPMTDNISEYVREVVLVEPEVTTYEGCSGSEFEFEVQNFNALNSGDIQTFHWYDRADDENPIHYGAKFETHVTGSGWGTFYVAAVSHTGCEGPRATVWVNLRPKPKDPVALNQYRCGPGKVTLGVGGNHYNYEYVWYNVSTSEELGRGRTFETPVLTNSRSYKVIAYHNGCESDPTFVSAIVNIVDTPAQPVVEIECARQYLKVDDSGKEEGIEWYWQGLNDDGKDRSVKADKDLLVSAPGTYYIRAYDPETYCWSASVPTEVLANEVPRIVPDDCSRISVNLGDLATPSPEYPTSDRYNYVKTFSPRQTNVSVDDIEDQLNPLGNESLGLVTAYFDGLGRALQTVSRRASSDGTDFVQPYEYDEFGRSARDYSPYASDYVSGEFVLNPFQEQKTKLKAHFVEDDIFFGLTSYEDSPVERVSNKMAAGNAWVGSGVGTKINYLTNTLTDDVKVWTITGEGVPETNNAFANGELHVVSTDDEEGITTKEYRDKSGKLLLKKSEASGVATEGHSGWLSTYYIYDDKNQLLFIVPPNAVDALSDAGWVWNTEDMKPLVYQNAYDGLGRQITKQIPGGSRVDMVYDKHDRLVASQDGNQRDGEPEEINWTFNKFDSHSRPVMTGLFYSIKDRGTLQKEIEDGLFSTNITRAIPESPGITEAVDLKLSEHRATTDVYRARKTIVLLPGFNSNNSEFHTEINDQLSIDNHEGYNDGVFPANADQLEIHEVIYYDDYRFTNKIFDTSYPAFEEMDNGIDAQPIANTNGLRTGSRVRVLGTDQWMENVYYYDNQQRLIQQRIDNRNGGEKIETRQYDFVGKKLQSHTKITNPEAEDLREISIRKKFTYDDEGRLTKVEQDLNNSGTFRTIGAYAYDPMGKMGQRVLGNNLETLDYTYNVRGWIRGINGQELKNDGIMEDRFFAMSLSYGHGFNKVQTDGMVSGQIWKSKTDPTIRAFGYDYDPLNRLVKADYSQKEADGSWDVNFADYSVDNMVYDAAGNITSLRRQGMVGGMKEEIDALSYTYSPTILNQLVKVEDGSTNDEGFKNINTDEDDFVYDANGNVITDANKDIAYVNYNYLNLPEKVTMFTDEGVNKNVTYIYDGLGKKLSEVTNDNGEITTIDYIDGLTYENGLLKTFPHDEGRVRNTSKGLVYDYYVKDHLGNNRMTLTEDRKETEYLATMETEDDPVEGVNLAEYEEELFTNLATVRVPYGNANYTVNLSFEADKVARLNGNRAAGRVGPGKMLAVSTGDIINMEAFAYYEGEAPVGDAISPLQMVGAVAGAFGGLDGGSQEQQYIFNQFNTASGAILAGPDMTDNDQPRAYLNYLLFDENFNYVDAGFVQVGEEAYNELGNPDAEIKHQQLKMQRSITSNGYIFIYVSNESDVDFNVYFDDLRIKHTQGSILSEDQYYPYGMKISGLSFNAPKVEGIAAGDKFSIGWNDLGFRSYDPKIARFYATDPLGENSAHLSTYHYAKDNPVSNFDAFGLQATGSGNEDEDEWIKRLMEQYRVDFSVEEVDPKTHGGNSYEVVITVVGQRVPREFRELNWKERIIDMQLDIIKREKAAEKEADKLAQGDQDRNNRKTTEGLPFTAGVTHSTSSSSNGPDSDSENKNENSHLTKTQRASQKGDGSGKSEHEQFNLDNANATQLLTTERRGQGAMNSNRKGDGNFNKEGENDGSEDRTAVSAAIVYTVGKDGANGNVVDTNGDNVSDDGQDDDVGDYSVQRSGGDKKFEIEAKVTLPSLTVSAKIVPKGDNWSDKDKKNLSERANESLRRYGQKVVNGKREELENPDTRKQAAEEVKQKLKDYADDLVNGMEEEGPGNKFLAENLPDANTEEDRDDILSIADDMNKVGDVVMDEYDPDYDKDDDYGSGDLIDDLSDISGCSTWSCLAEFMRQLRQGLQDAEDAINNSPEPSRIVSIVNRLTPAQLKRLKPEARISALETLPSRRMVGWGPGDTDAEGAGKKLVQSFHPDENGENGEDDILYNYFGTDKGRGVLGELHNQYDDGAFPGSDENYSEFVEEVTKTVRNNFSDEERSQIVDDAMEEGDVFLVDEEDEEKHDTDITSSGDVIIETKKVIGVEYEDYTFHEDGEDVTIQVPVKVYGEPEPRVYVNPLKLVLIVPKRDLPGLGISEGDMKLVPAYTVHYITDDFKQKRTTDRIIKTIEVISLPFAVGEFVAAWRAFKVARVLLASADLAATALDFHLSVDENRQDIINAMDDPSTPNVNEGVDFVNKLQLATGITSLATMSGEGMRAWDNYVNGVRKTVAKSPQKVKDALTPVQKQKLDEVLSRTNAATMENLTEGLPTELRSTANGFNDAGGKVVRDGDDLALYSSRVDDAGNEIGEEVARITKNDQGEDVLEVTSDRVKGALDELDETNKAALVTDLKNNPALLSELHKKPELKDSWNALGGAGGGNGLRTNLDHLNKVDSYLKKFPNRTPDDFKSTSSLFDNTEDYLDVLGDITDGTPVHGVNFDKFKSTSGTGGNTNFDEYSFSLFKKKEWGKLEEFYSSNSLNDGWPPANGGFNLQSGVELSAGARFDRFGNDFGTTANGNPNLGGSYTSPLNDGPFSFDQRALVGSQGDYQYYYEIEVLQDLDFTSELSDVIPWHGKTGGGEQSLWKLPTNPATGYNFTFTELAEAGLIKITIKDEPGGQVLQVIDNN